MKYSWSFIAGVSLGLGVAFAVFLVNEETQSIGVSALSPEPEVPPSIPQLPEDSLEVLAPDLRLKDEPVLAQPEAVNEADPDVIHLPGKYIEQLSIPLISGVTGLSDEFIEIFNLSEAQVTRFNNTFRQISSEIEHIESESAVLLESTDTQIVLEIPPFPEKGDSFENRLIELADELSPLAKQFYLKSLDGAFFSETSGFGLGTKTITITDINDEYMKIKEDIQRERSGKLGMSSTSSTSRLSELPAKYDHLLIEQPRDANVDL